MTSEGRDPAKAWEATRSAIETAIATLRAHRASLTEGQINDLKRILYNVPRLD